MRSRTAIGGLVGLMLAGLAAVAAIVAFIVVVVTVLTALAAVAAAAVAYIKRESWTLPAYRKARERTGKWSVTPWTSGPGQPQEEAEEPPVEAPAPTRWKQAA